MVKTKKEIILDTALHLFAGKGYESTPTSLIAKEAGVSEGLIFKHFTNKESLLEALVKRGYRQIADNSRGQLNNSDPANLISEVLDLTTKLVDEQNDFWHMQYRLVNDPIAKKHHARYLKSIANMLTDAFTKLGYKEPEVETEVLMLVVEGLWKFYVTDGDREHLKRIIRVVKEKYKQ